MPKYEIGMDVYSQDEKKFRLAKLAIDPHTKRVTDLIVENGLFRKASRVIPVELVDKISDEGLRLSTVSQEMVNYPEYRETDFTASDPYLQDELGYDSAHTTQWALRYGLAQAGQKPVTPHLRERVRIGVNPEEVVIGRGTRVCIGQETVGYIDHLLADDESGEISYLILRRGMLPFRAVIPRSMVREVSNETVYVEATRKELQALGKFTPRADQDLLSEVQAKLRKVTRFDLSQVKASLMDGLVTLTGSVANVAGKRETHRIIAGIKGVLGIDDNIMTDTEIEARVTTALLSEPYTFLADIAVQSEHGMVTLKGTVGSEEAGKIAEVVAAAQEGVVEVNSELLVEAAAQTPTVAGSGGYCRGYDYMIWPTSVTNSAMGDNT